MFGKKNATVLWKTFRVILIIEPTRCTNFSNLFLEKSLHISDSSSVHHQEFFTVHTAMVYVIQFCCVYSEKSWWWTEELSETCRVLIFCWRCISIYLFTNINKLDALNFISLFQASICFEHICSSSGGQNCIIQALVSSDWKKWVV